MDYLFSIVRLQFRKRGFLQVSILGLMDYLFSIHIFDTPNYHVLKVSILGLMDYLFSIGLVDIALAAGGSKFQSLV